MIHAIWLAIMLILSDDDTFLREILVKTEIH